MEGNKDGNGWFTKCRNEEWKGRWFENFFPVGVLSNNLHDPNDKPRFDSTKAPPKKTKNFAGLIYRA